MLDVPHIPNQGQDNNPMILFFIPIRLCFKLLHAILSAVNFQHLQRIMCRSKDQTLSVHQQQNLKTLLAPQTIMLYAVNKPGHIQVNKYKDNNLFYRFPLKLLYEKLQGAETGANMTGNCAGNSAGNSAVVPHEKRENKSKSKTKFKIKFNSIHIIDPKSC